MRESKLKKKIKKDLKKKEEMRVNDERKRAIERENIKVNSEKGIKY